MNKWIKIWYGVLVAVFLLGTLFLLNNYFVPRGHLELSYDFSRDPTLISEITPRGRASDRMLNLKTKETVQRISGEPTYFTVTAPRSFDTAKVSFTYRNPEQNILELGLQKSEAWNFELKPLENKLIDNFEWDRLEKDNLILLQKQKQFNSIDNFLQNLHFY